MLLYAVYVLFIVHSSIKSIVAKCPAHPEWPVCPYPSLLSFSIVHYKCYATLSASKPAFLHSISPCHALMRQEICCFCTNKSLSANGHNRHRLRSIFHILPRKEGHPCESTPWHPRSPGQPLTCVTTVRSSSQPSRRSCQQPKSLWSRIATMSPLRQRGAMPSRSAERFANLI